MGLLQYTSNEMFSSTELVRKNKNIFDKLNKNEIEKAIILRDGKPGIILMDFTRYEEIMKEYLLLKESKNNHKQDITKPIKNEIIPQMKEQKESIEDDELKSALDEIDKIDFSFDSSLAKEKSEALKEFWD
uniref:hypothetical protein n=1 Tax=Aliarcobacter sp. TaxID=2321116 RepID=UPI004048B65D